MLFFARHFEADARGQILDGFDEAQVIVLHQEAERRAVRAAAEAVIELLVRHDREGRRFLAVKRAAGLEFLALLFQRHAAADQLDDVGAGDQLVDEVLWNASGHDSVAASAGM